jgi:hypothetical protein
MRIAALALIGAGVLFIVAGALAPFDFALAVRKGWHVTVFPSPHIGVAFLAVGVVALLASFVWR